MILVLIQISISFSFILIIFDKQSPLTSISLPNDTIPTFVFGTFFNNEFILFSIEHLAKSNLFI